MPRPTDLDAAEEQISHLQSEVQDLRYRQDQLLPALRELEHALHKLEYRLRIQEERPRH